MRKSRIKQKQTNKNATEHPEPSFDLQRFAADELEISEPELEARLSQLAVLLPDLHSRLAAAPPQLVAKLAGEVRSNINNNRP